RLPRGVEPRRHVKLGPGGLSDVEWTVQLLQMQHGKDHESLQTTQTLAALDAAQDAGLLGQVDAEPLREAWVLATSLRAAISLRGSSTNPDVLPTDVRDLKVLAEIMNL